MFPRPLAQAIGASAEITQCEGEFVRVGRGPGKDAFELCQVVPDGTDFAYLCFNNLWISHDRNRSMSGWSALFRLSGSIIRR